MCIVTFCCINTGFVGTRLRQQLLTMASESLSVTLVDHQWVSKFVAVIPTKEKGASRFQRGPGSLRGYLITKMIQMTATNSVSYSWLSIIDVLSMLGGFQV